MKKPVNIAFNQQIENFNFKNVRKRDGSENFPCSSKGTSNVGSSMSLSVYSKSESRESDNDRHCIV